MLTASESRKKARLRNGLIQVAFFLALAATLAYGAHNVSTQLKARGISSGFDFLSHQAGFGIAFHLLPYAESSPILQVFLVGAVNTLFISVLGIVIATALGFVIALFRLSSLPVLRAIGTIYVETLRNIPLLLQFFVWYFAVLRKLPMPLESIAFGKLAYLNIRGLYIPFPDDLRAVWSAIGALAFGLFIGHYLNVYAVFRRRRDGRYPLWRPLSFLLPVLCPLLVLVVLGKHIEFSIPQLEGFNYSGGAQIIPELLAAVLALGLYTASFIAEIIRGAIQAVAKQQREAALALGMKPMQVLRQVILPQALGHIIPPLTSQYLNLIKNSSLAAAIAFPELVLVFAGTSLNVSGQAVEIMAMTLGFYLAVSLSVSALINIYQARALRYERH